MVRGVAMSTSPRMAIQAEIGASISDTPSQKCASAVNRLVKEYRHRNNNTGTDSISGHQFGTSRQRKIAVEIRKPSEQSTVKKSTVEGFKVPAGKWRLAVRGLRASMSRS